MTGSLERGARRAAQQFNLAVKRLEELDAVPVGFFPLVTEEATMDEVGVASLQLAGYLDDSPAPAERTEGPLFGTLAVSHLGDLKELEQLRKLRQTLRKSDPDLLQKLGAQSPEGASEEARSGE